VGYRAGFAINNKDWWFWDALTLDVFHNRQGHRVWFLALPTLGCACCEYRCYLLVQGKVEQLVIFEVKAAPVESNKSVRRYRFG